MSASPPVSAPRPVVAITGATAGLGLATARALASQGAEVALIGRDVARLAEAAELVAADGGTDGGTVRTQVIDLADLASVAAGAAALSADLPRLDVLINNAGVMFTPLQRTAQGHELQFGTNHLGHFLLSRLLLTRLADDEGARIVNLSSAGHKMADIDLGDVDWRTREYDKFDAYGAAKTANLLFTVEAQRRWSPHGVQSFAVHPGTVATDLARHMGRGDFKEMVARAPAPAAATPSTEPVERIRFATPEEGAATSIWAATAPELDGRGGSYLADAAISDDVRDYAVDPARAAALWELSEELLAADGFR